MRRWRNMIGLKKDDEWSFATERILSRRSFHIRSTTNNASTRSGNMILEESLQDEPERWKSFLPWFLIWSLCPDIDQMRKRENLRENKVYSVNPPRLALQDKNPFVRTSNTPVRSTPANVLPSEIGVPSGFLLKQSFQEIISFWDTESGSPIIIWPTRQTFFT